MLSDFFQSLLVGNTSYKIPMCFSEWVYLHVQYQLI